MSISTFASILAAEDPSQTHSWIWPEKYELLFGAPASILIFGLLYWKAGPVIKKGMAARTERIQAALDAASAAQASAADDAAQIRQALGDIESERARMLDEASAQAEALLVDGRARISAEAADLEAKADADIIASAARGTDELRAEIARLSSAATEHVVNGQLDASVHNDLIEAFISKVGASR